jgi:two-component system sensor histidine kinase RegB
MEHAGGHAHGQSGMWMHLQGMWFAFGITAAFIAYFIQRITRALAHRDADLTAARMLSARQERLASLATLAAGATHELSTPLSTIAVVAKELEHQLENGGGSPDAVEDARLIRRQVDRCREILVQLAADAGESSGEAFRVVSVEQLLRLALDGLHDVDRIQLPTDATLIGHTLRIPPRAIAQALRAVIKNAREASAADRPITIAAEIDHGMWRLAVRDHGAGMTEQTLARAAEPFFTTKADNGGQSGMGLGLFLARAVLERIGGRLDLASEPGLGTTAVLTVPMDATPADARADLAASRPLISSALGG